MSAWFLYVVRCADGTFYTGVTTDITRRLHEHNATKRGAKYTKTRRPVELIYRTNYKDRSTAQKAERYFKTLTRQEKEEIIKINAGLLTLR